MIKLSEKLTYSQYIQQYKNEHYENIRIMAPKERHLRDDIKACAKDAGLSANAWILKVIEDAIAQAKDTD